MPDPRSLESIIGVLEKVKYLSKKDSGKLVRLVRRCVNCRAEGG